MGGRKGYFQRGNIWPHTIAMGVLLHCLTTNILTMWDEWDGYKVLSHSTAACVNII